jgi:hypothetical protein
MFRLTMYVVLLVTVGIANDSFALNPTRESEPNDFKIQATHIVVNNGSVRGQISSTVDKDIYSFEASATGVVRFLIGVDNNCATGSGSLRATVSAPDDTTITSRPITGCIPGTLTIVDAATPSLGTYYLTIDAATSTPTPDDYVITPLTKTSPLQIVDRESEPNNNPASATVITLNGGEVRGQLSGTFDLDYFAFHSSGGTSNFVIGVENECGSGAPPETGIRVSVRAVDGTLITSKNLIGCTSGTTRASITTIQANTPVGNYYLLFQPQDAATPIKNDYVIYPTGLSEANATCVLDLDGNGTIDALTDGIMLLRAFFGLSGTSVTNGALGAGATRTTWPEIRVYLNSNCGTSF